jgi:hypothetical protein
MLISHVQNWQKKFKTFSHTSNIKALFFFFFVFLDFPRADRNPSVIRTAPEGKEASGELCGAKGPSEYLGQGNMGGGLHKICIGESTNIALRVF